jgi:hypothetical protein
LDFSPEVIEAIKEHDFPQEIVDNPYWKISVLADYMYGQKASTVEERLGDIKTRWIDQLVERGLPPRIEPERFAQAEKTILAIRDEIFGHLHKTENEFINEHKLNSAESQTRWERFLLKTQAAGREDRAKRLVELFIEKPGKRKD